HVGDGLEAAVRMAREAGDVVLGLVGAELVQHQERIEHVEFGRTDDPGQLDPGAIGRGHAAQLADHAGGGVGRGHGRLLGYLWQGWRQRTTTGSGLAGTQCCGDGIAPGSRRERRSYRAVRRQARWMRGLRAKSGGMVSGPMSSQRANPATAASSRRKRRKLLEKYSTPPGASRATAARSSPTCAACTSKSPARLELEEVGGSQNTRSYWPVSASSHCSASAWTRRCARPPSPFSRRLSAHHCR